MMYKSILITSLVSIIRINLTPKIELIFEAEFPEAEELYTAPIKFVGKSAASTPNGEDLLVHKSDGYVEVWNKYWAFGGSKPDDESITYNYPNPFTHHSNFSCLMFSQ